ncbi:MAG: carbonic anhydrase, partial [Phycisphaerales bacterium]
RLTKDRRDASNPEFVDRVAAINVRNMMKWIVDNSPTLASMVANGEIAVVGAMYDVATGRVEYLDGASVAGQVAPPAVAAGARR